MYSPITAVSADTRISADDFKILDEMTDEEQEKYIVEVFGIHKYYQWLNHFIDISECSDQIREYTLTRKLFFAQSIA
jgi:hypothetical protein